MAEAVVMPITLPDRDMMRQHLEHLFGGDLDGCHDGLIEIAWTSSTPDKSGRHSLRHAQLFPVDALDQAIDEAYRQNCIPKQNVYVGAALRKPDTPPFGRGEDSDFYAATCVFVDLDDGDATRHARTRYAAAPPTRVVVTGRHPDLRAQCWWRLETPERDPDRFRTMNEALCARLYGDPTVVNPSRVMRLGGSIAWPLKEGRQLEVTEVTKPSANARTFYIDALLMEAFPPLPQINGTKPSVDRSAVHSTNSLGLDDGKIIDGREAYMRDTVMACFVEYVGENGAEPEPGELFDIVWPQYSAKVDLSGRPGRGADEVMDKCVQIARRFARGQLPHLPDLNAVVASYQAKKAQAAPRPESAAAPLPSPAVDDEPFSAASLVGEPPPREWLVPNWLPRGTVTALYGDGGVGKTLLAQQLANCLATGGDFMGLAVPKGRALGVFCEDDKDELWRRQNAIERASGITLRAQVSDLFLWPRVGHDNVLVNFDMTGLAKAGAFLEKLRARVAEMRPDLLILDTAADLFGGNENNRTQVNQFVKHVLGGFVVDFGCTVLLLAHPSMSGLSSGSGAGGSTAWNNAVRSRWYLSRPETGLQDQRVLTRKKANYAASGDDQKIEMVWENGALTTQPGPDTVDKINLGAIKRAVADAVEAEWLAGRPVGSQNSGRPWRSVLPRLVRHEPALVLRAFVELERDGVISKDHGDTHKRGYKVLSNA